MDVPAAGPVYYLLGVVMSTELAIIISTLIYKLASLGIGLIFCILGYKLFTLGIWGRAGNFETNLRDIKIVLKSAAPGTFFAVLGAFIVLYTISQGLNYNWIDGNQDKSINTEKKLEQIDKPKLP
ncbi:hypothetical protein [Chitinolyticbacter meiyuanensis]|uniref:hypothetical protein n=1 Tax=Chitinolyticbacter meiyuanensis TaxID=682798 RepID=UPI0011E5957A|nr:hypothetical protein [Chitinolyticbacter meiyuanensis]